MYGKGKDVGEIKFVISFVLEVDCMKHPEVLGWYLLFFLNISYIAIDTIGKVIIKPKKATL